MIRKKRILIVGAGVAGKRLLEEILSHKNSEFKVLGFIDDSKKKIGSTILGVPVLGNIKEIKYFIKFFKIEKILIALPSVDGTIVSDIVKKCLEVNTACQIIPRFGEIIEGKIDVKAIRDVKIDDLLGRPLRMHDFSDVPTLIRDKTILVTGAAGSIGSELCRQIASYKPKKIVMYDWWENGLYELGIEFKEFFGDCSIVLVPGNIQDKLHIESTLKKYKPSIIFHAAAYKHVPLMEDNILEAVKNNIFGIYNVVTSAVETKVKMFVFISTDKAVNPKSIMGITKLIGECITTSLHKNSKTKFICVRFGNVLNSAGSVLPLFRKQLPSGSITITDKKMTRFFMTIQEAVQLILKAAVLGKKNEIFILDMGKPMKIIDIAKKFILLSGLIPDKDISIKFIGQRPGEKLNEELATASENVTKTKFDKLFVIKRTYINEEKILKLLKELQAHCDAYDEDMAKRALRKFVTDINRKHAKPSVESLHVKK